MNKILIAKSPSGSPVLIFTNSKGELVYMQLNGQPYTGSCDQLTYECCAGGSSEGKSAYDIAVDNGFSGTVQEWLDSLTGQNGNSGITPTPIWNGTQLAFDLTGDGNPDTTPVDLQGPAGSGGGTSDNWGTQVVVSDNTLTGDGTNASPLTVNTSTLQVDWSNIQNIPSDIADGDDVGTPGSGEQNVSTLSQNLTTGEISHSDGDASNTIVQVTSQDTDNSIITGSDGGSKLNLNQLSFNLNSNGELELVFNGNVLTSIDTSTFGGGSSGGNSNNPDISFTKTATYSSNGEEMQFVITLVNNGSTDLTTRIDDVLTGFTYLSSSASISPAPPTIPAPTYSSITNTVGLSISNLVSGGVATLTINAKPFTTNATGTNTATLNNYSNTASVNY